MSENGKLQVDVSANASGFAATMRQVSAHAKKASSEIASEVTHSYSGIGKGFLGGIAGAFTFEAIKGSFEGFLQKAAGIRELTEQMDMGADATQRWAKASDRLGLSFTGMQSVLLSIGQKRQDALTDPKAAEMFNRLGVPREAVVDRKKYDESEFAKLVLNAGRNGGDEGKAALMDIVGKRGVKYAGAAEVYDHVKPTFDEKDLKIAHEAEMAEKKIGSEINKAWSRFLKYPIANALTAGMYGLGANVVEKIKQADENLSKVIRANLTKGTKAAEKPPEYIASPKDPLDSVLAEAKFQRDEREASARDRIEAAKRANMTSSAKRESLKNELADVQNRLKEAAWRKAPDNLKGEDLAEWETKRQEQKAALEVREQGLIGDLREKPFGPDANSLSKSGLFTSSTMGGADSALSYQRETVATLKSIDRKLSLDGPLNRH